MRSILTAYQRAHSTLLQLCDAAISCLLDANSCYQRARNSFAMRRQSSVSRRLSGRSEKNYCAYYLNLQRASAAMSDPDSPSAQSSLPSSYVESWRN